MYGMSATQLIELRLLLRPNKHDIGIKISVEKITLKLARLEVGDPLRPKAERDVMSRYTTLSEQDPNRQRSNDCQATQTLSSASAPPHVGVVPRTRNWSQPNHLPTDHIPRLVRSDCDAE